MELKFEVRLDYEDLCNAVREYAAKFLPVMEGYHIEVDITYSFANRAYLVKDAEPEAADVAIAA